MFTSSSRSKEFSSSFNTSNSKSYSIISTNLQGGLQSIPQAFNQIWFKKLNIYELPNYKWHLLRFVIMLIKNKSFSISICDLTILRIWWVKKPTIGNMASHFPHHSKGHLIFLGSTWQHLKIIFLVISFFFGSFVLRTC